MPTMVRTDADRRLRFGSSRVPPTRVVDIRAASRYSAVAWSTSSNTGPALSPTNAFHNLTGIETLPLRMDRHVANARAVAAFLADHPAVAWVSYAGLPSRPFHDLAARYLPRGAGSVFRRPTAS